MNIGIYGAGGFGREIFEMIPKSNLALVGLYAIEDTRALFACLEYNIQNEIRTQNEYHLTDALQCMIAQGVAFRTFAVDSWFDCGKKDIILQTNPTGQMR